MATTVVLQPRYLRNPNPRPNQSPGCRCRRRRKRSPSDGNGRSYRDSLPKAPVMGQVKILKRGEELKARMLFGKENVDLCSTNRLGPDPDVVQKQIRVPDLYGGPTSMVLSPHPSSVPFPATFVRKNVVESNLRKLLRI